MDQQSAASSESACRVFDGLRSRFPAAGFRPGFGSGGIYVRCDERHSGQRIGDVQINTLEIKRSNGRTWMQSPNKAVISWKVLTPGENGGDGFTDVTIGT